MSSLDALDAELNAASQLPELVPPLHALAKSAGLTNFAILRLRGASFEHLVQLVHSAPAPHADTVENAGYWRSSSLIQTQLARCMPQFYEGGPAPADVPGFEHGVITAMGEARGVVMLVLARSTPIAMDERLDIMRCAVIALPRLEATLSRLQLAACPLSARQLDALRHCLAGFTAAETGRALNVGTRTVEEYLLRARQHLQVNNSLAAAMRAIDMGWLSLSEVQALLAA